MTLFINQTSDLLVDKLLQGLWSPRIPVARAHHCFHQSHVLGSDCLCCYINREHSWQNFELKVIFLAVYPYLGSHCWATETRTSQSRNHSKDFTPYFLEWILERVLTLYWLWCELPSNNWHFLSGVYRRTCPLNWLITSRKQKLQITSWSWGISMNSVWLLLFVHLTLPTL